MSVTAEDVGEVSRCTKVRVVVEVERSDRNWASDDGRRHPLSGPRKEGRDIANGSQHSEGGANSAAFDTSGARLVMLLTAALSEYIWRTAQWLSCFWSPQCLRGFPERSNRC